MLRATPQEMAAAPIGRFVTGATFVHYCIDAGLWGFLLWGSPSEADAIQLGSTLVLELAPPAVPHASIVDASRLQGGNPGSFLAAGRYLTKHHAALGRWVTRLALVRPPGIYGAVVAGAFEVLPRPFPVSTFDDTAAALAWLSPEHPHGADLLEAMYCEATGTPPVLGALRAYLEAHLADAEIADAAGALGLSLRTLQRKLGASDTTFKRELAEARIRVAKRKLIEGDAPLTTIAFDVGCASLQHFSALFRREVRESPSAFRAREQKARAT